MVLETEPDYKGPRERNKLALKVEPETKKPRKKSMRLQEPFYFSLLFVCLS